MQQPEEHCQEAEQLPAELPVPIPEASPVVDQHISPISHSMEQQDDSEDAGARAIPPPPSSSAAVAVHSAAAGLPGEQAATGSDVSLPPAASKQQQSTQHPAPPAPQQEDEDGESFSVGVVEGGPSSPRSPSLDVPLYDGPLEDTPLSNGCLMGETKTMVRVCDNGEIIIRRTCLRYPTLRAIRSMMPLARLMTQRELEGKLPPGFDIHFQSFPRSQPEPETVPVDTLTEVVEASLLLDGSGDEGPKKIKNKDKGKQKAKEEEAAPPPEQGSSSASSPPQERPPPEIDVAWERHPDRPLQKLPIRFYDAVGRHYIWPWSKAKSWKSAKSLIEAAFMHVDVIGPHVLEGHYDLVVRGAFVDNDTARVSRRLTSYPPQPASFRPPPPPPPPSSSFPEKIELTTSITTVAVIAPEDFEDVPTPPAPSSNSPPSAERESDVTRSPEPPTKPVTAPIAPGRVPGKGGRGAILLPELWDDVIEPGMVIQMHMWPMVPSIPPPPPPHIMNGPGNVPGMGRGMRPSFHHGQPPMPPGMRPMAAPPPPLIIEQYKPPKGKTRKRQDGL